MTILDIWEGYDKLSGYCPKFKEKNIENPLQSLVKENIYLVDNYASEVKLNYLREHYYPEARAEVYKEVDGYTIWKFYEK